MVRNHYYFLIDLNNNIIIYKYIELFKDIYSDSESDNDSDDDSGEDEMTGSSDDGDDSDDDNGDNEETGEETGSTTQARGRPMVSDLRAVLLADDRRNNGTDQMIASADLEEDTDDARERLARLKANCKKFMELNSSVLSQQAELFDILLDDIQNNEILRVSDNWLKYVNVGRRNIQVYTYVKDLFSDDFFEAIKGKISTFKALRVQMLPDKSAPKLLEDDEENDANAQLFEQFELELSEFLPDSKPFEEGKWTIKNLYRVFKKLDEHRYYCTTRLFSRLFGKELHIRQKSTGEKKDDENSVLFLKKKLDEQLKLNKELIKEINELKELVARLGTSADHVLRV
jgi:hypothetical protein